jgi:hypothetical protein
MKSRGTMLSLGASVDQQGSVPACSDIPVTQRSDTGWLKGVLESSEAATKL